MLALAFLSVPSAFACPDLRGEFQCPQSGAQPASKLSVTQIVDGDVTEYQYRFEAYPGYVGKTRASDAGVLQENGAVYKCTPTRIVMWRKEESGFHSLQEQFLTPEGDYKVLMEEKDRMLCKRIAPPATTAPVPDAASPQPEKE